MNELINIFGQWPKLTLVVITPFLAFIVGFSWFFSGYSASQLSNLGTKTYAFWKWVIWTLASLVGVLGGTVLMILAIMKATGGDIPHFFYQMAGMLLIAVSTALVCDKVEKNILGALAK